MWTKNEHWIIDLIDSDVLAYVDDAAKRNIENCFLGSVGETEMVYGNGIVYGLRTWSILTGLSTVGLFTEHLSDRKTMRR